ncbi:MAG: thiolase C-terminal domain-containing protein [Bacillota bacterium]
MPRKVGIVGIGHTHFGKWNGSFTDLCCQAAVEALEDAGIRKGSGKVDQLLLSTMGAQTLNRQSGVASALVDTLNLRPAMAETIENGPASGASAVKLAYAEIAGGLCDVVLVVGAEMMLSVDSKACTDLIATLLHPEVEYPYGLTLPAMAGLFTRLCMERYGITEEDLALVAIKNHQHALYNPLAQFHSELTLAKLRGGDLKNPYIAEPLHLYDVCPISDGAAALVLCAMDVADRFSRKPMQIRGIGQATDTHAVAEREVPTDLLAVRLAARRAYAMSGLTPEDIDVAELHDAFVILEIVESEEAGLFPKGQGHLAVRRGDTMIGGRIPVNTSGGLKAKGHPLGATGVSQIHELVVQLRGEAGKRQVKGARAGLAINFGGFGNNVVATVLTREE